jgi:cytoskeleton protein RodZ
VSGSRLPPQGTTRRLRLGGGGLQSISETLRSAREAQGHTLEDASLATRIRVNYLEALETEPPESWGRILGGDIYAKGFLRSYAAYLGLDPAPLVQEYRSQSGTESQALSAPPRPVGGALGSRPRPQPNWMVVGGVMAAIVVVLGVISLITTRAGGEDSPPVAAPVTTAPPTTQAPTTTAAPTTTLPPGVNVVLRIRDAQSWVNIRVDGRAAFTGMLQPGEERPFNGRQEVALQLGNAGAVHLTVDGQNLGVAGDPGQVVNFTFPVDVDPAEVFAQGR